MPPWGRSSSICLLAAVCLTGVLGTPASAGASPAAACSALRGLDLEGLPDAPTRIDTAEPVAGDAGRPAHCRVTGYVAPKVRFELLLPEPPAWNGKFLFGGCGGLCGSLETDLCHDGLARGYASATTDTGHRGVDFLGAGTTVLDALWAYQDEQAVIDWAHRGVHVSTLATKRITEAYYDRAIATSYFVGCSNGGRQAMMEAQRYPDDFDGIFAGDPGLDFRTVALDWIWAANANLDEDGAPILTEADIEPLHQAVIKQCDGLDGTTDGRIGDPRSCRLDLDAIAADLDLDARQVEALRRLYSTPTNSRGERLTDGGLLPGSEGDWPTWVTGTGGFPPFNQVLGDGMLRYLAFDEPPGPTYDPRTFDFDRDPARMGEMLDLVSAVDPDLRPFRDTGGKLLMIVGWGDGVLRPTASVAYYERVVERFGGDAATQPFLRLFTVPGKTHCTSAPMGGPADPLRLLENWVERGQAPDTITVEYGAEDGRPGHRRQIPIHTAGGAHGA